MSLSVADLSGVAVTAVNPAATGANPLPSGYVDFTLTDADQVWEQTGYGSGSIVAVVDTGTAPNLCLSQALTGAPGFPDGFNATPDGIPPAVPKITGRYSRGRRYCPACWLDFSAFPDHPLCHRYLNLLAVAG
jgi:hypothetical protein